MTDSEREVTSALNLVFSAVCTVEDLEALRTRMSVSHMINKHNIEPIDIQIMWILIGAGQCGIVSCYNGLPEGAEDSLVNTKGGPSTHW